MDNTANIAEARHLLAELTPHADRMKPLDARYFATLRYYLERMGDGAQITERRLTWIRALHTDYTAKPSALTAVRKNPSIVSDGLTMAMREDGGLRSAIGHELNFQ